MATVTVEKNTYTVEPLYQWDLNQELVIYGLSLASVPEVHFTNAAMGKAIVRQATMDAAGVIRAQVPNSLLQKPYTVLAYVCTYAGTTFETQYKLEVPVKVRNKPEDYTLENDPEVYSFNALENQVVNALRQIAGAESDYNEAKALAADAQAAYNAAVKDIRGTVQEVVQDELAGNVIGIVQSVYDTDQDGAVDRAEQAENGLYLLTHGYQAGPGLHTLTGTVPASGQFTVCFTAARAFAASHSAVVRLNGSVNLTLVSPGHTNPPANCFTQGELVTGTVVLSSATAGTLVLSSTPPIHKTGGTTSGSIVIGGYILNEGSTVVATNYSRQVRNVTLSTEEPTGGINGDLWLQYEG